MHPLDKNKNITISFYDHRDSMAYFPTIPKRELTMTEKFTEPTDAAIEAVVRTFYGRIREDVFLGPVFASAIEDWGPHLKRMMGFWTAVLRGEPTFSPRPGAPPPTLHRQLEMTRSLMRRWLRLFETTTRELATEELAQVWLARAQRIGGRLAAHLPEEESSYKMRTFTAADLPKGLLKAHRLAKGVRARLSVLRGEVTYVQGDGQKTLRMGDEHAVPSQLEHHIEITPDARIRLEFFRDGKEEPIREHVLESGEL